MDDEAFHPLYAIDALVS